MDSLCQLIGEVTLTQSLPKGESPQCLSAVALGTLTAHQRRWKAVTMTRRQLSGWDWREWLRCWVRGGT